MNLHLLHDFMEQWDETASDEACKTLFPAFFPEPQGVFVCVRQLWSPSSHRMSQIHVHMLSSQLSSRQSGTDACFISSTKMLASRPSDCQCVDFSGPSSYLSRKNSGWLRATVWNICTGGRGAQEIKVGLREAGIRSRINASRPVSAQAELQFCRRFLRCRWGESGTASPSSAHSGQRSPSPPHPPPLHHHHHPPPLRSSSSSLLSPERLLHLRSGTEDAPFL